MSKTLGPVALKLGDEVLVKIRTDTAIKDLLEQLDKACKGGRIQDADGFDVTAHYSQDLPEGEYAIKQPTAAVRTLDDVTIISEATARAFHRLQQEKESEREETICCTASSTPLAMVQRHGVRLSARTDVVVHSATTTFRAIQGQLNRYLQIWELKTTKALQGQALVQFLAINIVTNRPGWGVPVVLSDLTEASVFQRGTGPNDIIHIQFKNLEEAYAHIRWLLDRSKAENPDLLLDTSLAPPAVGMFTIMEQQAHSETDSMSADERLLSKEYDADNQCILRKVHVFRKLLHLLAANDDRVLAFVKAFSQDHQYMPSILDFVPTDCCG
ncbi:TPA: hypothetical protein ACH3X1_012537 [Trebouxia sp. C0004]